MESADVTLSAVWSLASVASWKITFDANGGSGTMEKQTVRQGTAAILSVNAFTRAGYTSIGWATAAGTTSAAYGPSASYTMGTADVTLYAVWRLNGISFYANGGKGTMERLVGTKGLTVYLPSNVFSREGHHFLGGGNDLDRL
jgi:uncharacterized repeat protein (TIGR02543 family)